MASAKDYYKILGLEENAGPDAIKKAYRSLARKHHPDHNPDDQGAEERFKEIQEAYDVLSDAKTRRQYDRARTNPFGSSFGGAFETSTGGRFYRAPDGSYVRFDEAGRAAGQPDDGLFGGLGDILGKMFGADGAPVGQRPADTEIEVALSFDQMLSGGKANVQLPDGRRARVPYPRGVKDGYRVRLRNAAPSDRSGTLYVRFRVGRHPEFERQGSDLLTSVRVNVIEALLGATRSITTPQGKTLKLTIPKGAQPGEKLRLRGQGIQTEDGSGDILVEILIRVPKNLDPADEETLRKAAKKAGLI
jgi:DnaJ-class molecular chaperone